MIFHQDKLPLFLLNLFLKKMQSKYEDVFPKIKFD